MRANARTTPRAALWLCAALAAALLGRAQPASCADPPPRDKAIEKARALEEDGLREEARAYLQELTETERSFSQDPTILLELARLGTTAKETLAALDLVIGGARDPQLLARAHLLRGDHLFISGRYLAASTEYEVAARHAERTSAAAGAAALLKRGASLLAAGDASAALGVYDDISRRTEIPDDLLAWAELGAGRSLLLQGRSSQAAQRFDGTIGLYDGHPARPQALLAAAESHRAAGTGARALELLKTLADEHPESLEAITSREWLRALSSAEAASAERSPADGGPASEQ